MIKDPVVATPWEPLKDFNTGLNERGTWGAYVGIDQKIWNEAGDPTGAQGVSVFTVVHHAPDDVNPLTNYVDLAWSMKA